MITIYCGYGSSVEIVHDTVDINGICVLENHLQTPYFNHVTQPIFVRKGDVVSCSYKTASGIYIYATN